MGGDGEAASLSGGELLDERVGVLGVEEEGSVGVDVAERRTLGAGEVSAVAVGLEAPTPRRGVDGDAPRIGVEEVCLLGREDGGARWRAGRQFSGSFVGMTAARTGSSSSPSFV